MYSNKYVFLLFTILFSISKIYSQGTTTLTINSPTPVAVYKARDLVKVIPGVSGAKLTAGASTKTQLLIDPNVVAPIGVNGNPYSGYYVNSVYTIDKNLPVGAVNGSGGTNNGQAQYNIPIPIAPGTAGMVPNIGISYNSAQTDGIVGLGWGISGISAITRTQFDFYHTSSVAPIKLTNTDFFALDGNIIWGKAPTWSTDGSRRLESDNFTEVKPVNNYGSFLVTTKEGTIIEYGNTTDSKLMVNNDAGTPVPLAYYINKVTDKFGNYYTYQYYNQDGEVAIKEIQYTGNTNSNLLPYNSIKFYYQSRDDQNIKYFRGNQLKTTLILRQIEVFCELQSVKKFVPNYDLIDGISYLSSITEYGLDNSHLNPTTFAYETSSAFGQNNSINISSLPALADYKIADFNGDGKSDVLAYTYTTVIPSSGQRAYTGWQLYINQNDGSSYSMVASQTGNFFPYSYYGLPNTYSPDADGTTSINLNGDDKEDALFLKSAGGITSYTAQIANGNGFTPGYIFNLPTGANIIFCDIDGDKYPEGLAYNAPNNSLYIVNFKTSSIQVKTIYGLFLDANPAFATGSVTSMNILQTVDYDGDGIQEILAEINSKVRVLKVGNYFASPTGSNFVFNVLATDNYLSDATSHLNMYGDFNGDGLTDQLSQGTTALPNFSFLRYNTNKYNSSNSSFFLTPSTPLNTIITGVDNIDRRILLADMNNDGKTDIVKLIRSISYNQVDISVTYMGTNQVDLLIGTISGVIFPSAINYNYYTGQVYPTSGNLISEFSLGDFDGDGFIDIMFKNANSGGRTIFYNHPPSTEGKLAKVTNGFNQSIKFNYKTLAKGGIYIKGNGSSYPFVDIQSPIKIISSIEAQDANGNFYSTDYTYEGAKIHQQGKGFLGFDKISASNNLSQVKTVITNDLNITYARRTLINSKKYLLSNLSSPISETQNTYAFVFSNGDPSLPLGHYIKLVNTINFDNVKGGNSVTDYTYDNYLNLTNSNTQTNTGTTSSLTNIIDAALYGNKYPSYVSSSVVSVTKPGKLPVSKSTSFAYFPNGLLNQVTNNVGTTCSSFNNYVYNTNFGLPTSITANSANNAPRTSVLEYDAKFRFVTKNTNPLNHITETIYDNRFGVPLKTIDITNLTTKYVYDAYGSQTSVTTADNNTVDYITKWYDSNDDISGDPFPASNILITQQVNAPNSPLNRSFFTASGLNVKSITEGFNQNYMSNRATFNNRGQLDVAKASYLIPCSNPSKVLTTTNTYNDPYFRLTNTNVTDGTSNLNTNISYNQTSGINTTAVTTPDGITKTTKEDAFGELQSAQDNGGLITYDYYSDGSLKSTALNGITTMDYVYDACGNLFSQNEPHNGLTTFSFDGFGQLTSKLNDGKTYSFLYDVLGRPISMTGPEGAYNYSYITSGAGLENIETITAANGTSNKFYYDGLNRTYKTEEVVGATYATTIEFDQYSNPVKYTYPSGFAIKTAYNSIGYPTTIKNDATNNLIWQADEINSFGEYNKFTLGNTIQTVNTYNNFGMITNSASGNAFDHTYDFNITNGNLNYLIDNLKSLKETHIYDNLDRLTNSTVTDIIGGFNYPALTQTYDQKGNITNKSDIGNYQYFPNMQNAVKKVENTQSKISIVQQDITYTAFEKAENIIENQDEQAVITYGPNQERMKTQFSNIALGANYSTRYYLSNYEKEVKTGMTREVHYINAPTGLVAMHVIENGVANTYFTYSDHLGTLRTVTNANGNIVAEQNFDPWGQRRNPSSWDYNNVPAPPAWLFRGYTGHEHLPQFSLINMNGRMYDPQNARMLSADPILHDATSTQAYNKYSYCINNPLKYTDPSGYDFSFSTKNADVTATSIFGSDAYMSVYGTSTSNDVSVSMNLNGQGAMSIPEQNPLLGGDNNSVYAGTPGSIAKYNAMCGDMSPLFSGVDITKRYKYVTRWVHNSSINSNGTLEAEARIVRDGFSITKKTQTSNSGGGILSRIDEAIGAGLFGSSENYHAVQKHAGNDNPYMFSNQELNQAANIQLEIISMFVPVGEVFQGVKWAGRLAFSGRAASEGRVFWSGGKQAMNQAAKFAGSTGRKTLEMTAGGKIMTGLNPILPRSISNPIWNMLSKNFANGATESVHFFGNGLPRAGSIWLNTEKVILENNGVKIIYN